MSGHSKWAQIKRAKAVTDTKRGKIFTKLAREITVTARSGGGDPASNVTLRLLLDKARGFNMPKENIERAIKRGLGELKGEGELEEIYYEGYGLEGVALMVKVLTDNRNRTVGELRRIFIRNGGSLAESGSVAWQFDSKGLLVVPVNKHDPDELALEAIDSGAEDVQVDTDVISIYTAAHEFAQVRESLEARHIIIEDAELVMMPKLTVAAEPRIATQTLRLIDQLEELDDVQSVYHNLDISEEAVTEYEGQAM